MAQAPVYALPSKLPSMHAATNITSAGPNSAYALPCKAKASHTQRLAQFAACMQPGSDTSVADQSDDSTQEEPRKAGLTEPASDAAGDTAEHRIIDLSDYIEQYDMPTKSPKDITKFAPKPTIIALPDKAQKNPVRTQLIGPGIKFEMIRKIPRVSPDDTAGNAEGPRLRAPVKDATKDSVKVVEGLGPEPLKLITEATAKSPVKAAKMHPADPATEIHPSLISEILPKHMTVKVLREHLKFVGLKDSGTKPKLISRLNRWRESRERSTKMADSPAPSASGPSNAQTCTK